jgi:hypothetical protein
MPAVKYNELVPAPLVPFPKREAPQTLDIDRIVVGVLERAQESSVVGIESVDRTVAEVTHQQIVSERSETDRRDF